MTNEEKIDWYAKQIEEILDRHVPDPLKESFLALLCSTISSAENEHLNRIDVTNRVQQRLAATRRPVTSS